MILSHVTLHFLIKLAYELRDDQISNGSSWLSLKHFDIDAKCDPPVGGDPRKLGFEERNAYNKQLLLRLQSLMADRFHLKLRQETREMPVFNLVVSKSGPKFTSSTNLLASNGQVKRGSEVWAGHVEAYRVSMNIFARMLSNFLGRTVIDQTGLPASYDLKLDWSPDPADSFGLRGPHTGNPESRPDGNSAEHDLFTALPEQLGLRLESAKGAIPFFIVENATPPDTN